MRQTNCLASKVLSVGYTRYFDARQLFSDIFFMSKDVMSYTVVQNTQIKPYISLDGLQRHIH